MVHAYYMSATTNATMQDKYACMTMCLHSQDMLHAYQLMHVTCNGCVWQIAGIRNSYQAVASLWELIDVI